MTLEKIDSIILVRLYDAFFPKMGKVNLNSIHNELEIDTIGFWNIVDKLNHENLIKPITAGGNYMITSIGIISIEETNLIKNEIKEHNQSSRTKILDYLATLYEDKGPYSSGDIDTMSNVVEIDLDSLICNSSVLEDLDYVEFISGGCCKITHKGIQAVKEWRKKSDLIHSFEELSQLNPHSRGREFQKFLSKLLLLSEWNVEESARTNNEEMDIVIHKNREYYIIECKWEKDHIEASVVRELFGKLGNRIGMNGILVSMSGFTTGAIKQAKDFANQKMILLFGEVDINRLVTYEISFDEILNQKYQKLITNQMIEFS